MTKLRRIPVLPLRSTPKIVFTRKKSIDIPLPQNFKKYCTDNLFSNRGNLTKTFWKNLIQKKFNSPADNIPKKFVELLRAAPGLPQNIRSTIYNIGYLNQ